MGRKVQTNGERIKDEKEKIAKKRRNRQWKMNCICKSMVFGEWLQHHRSNRSRRSHRRRQSSLVAVAVVVVYSSNVAFFVWQLCRREHCHRLWLCFAMLADIQHRLPTSNVVCINFCCIDNFQLSKSCGYEFVNVLWLWVEVSAIASSASSVSHLGNDRVILFNVQCTELYIDTRLLNDSDRVCAKLNSIYTFQS